jgi:RNA polymerase sigma-19 factor, ECF subfamily
VNRPVSTEAAPPGPEAALDGGPPDGDTLDGELAARVQAGEAAAFEALFRRYYRRLYVFAEGYVRSPEVAEDLTVDVFARVWERRAEWSLRGSPRSYLYAAVRNEALAWLRRQRMIERAHEDAVRDERRPGMGGPPAPADAQVQAHELAEAVERAVGSLPERTREAFVLHRKHGLSYAEVGAAMEISPRTVEVLIRRAFKSLRAHLGAFLSLFLLYASL